LAEVARCAARLLFFASAFRSACRAAFLAAFLAALAARVSFDLRPNFGLSIGVGASPVGAALATIAAAGEGRRGSSAVLTAAAGGEAAPGVRLGSVGRATSGAPLVLEGAPPAGARVAGTGPHGFAAGGVGAGGREAGRGGEDGDALAGFERGALTEGGAAAGDVTATDGAAVPEVVTGAGRAVAGDLGGAAFSGASALASGSLSQPSSMLASSGSGFDSAT